MSATDRFINGIDMIKLLYGLDEIGVRLSVKDITSPSFEDDLQRLMSKIEFSPINCHLILDLNNADFTYIDDFTDGILAALSSFPSFKTWKSFTVCGGSFPATNLIKPGKNPIPRNEWKFYKTLVKKLKAESFNRPINYGDYSIVAPGHFDFDPKKMKRSANIRYTSNDIWLVIKGKALQKSEDYKQYFTQAEDILNSGLYVGERFSEGDMHLKKCTRRETTTGSPSVWNWVGSNHHFTKVVYDLFASPPSS